MQSIKRPQESPPDTPSKKPRTVALSPDLVDSESTQGSHSAGFSQLSSQDVLPPSCKEYDIDAAQDFPSIDITMDGAEDIDEAYIRPQPSPVTHKPPLPHYPPIWAQSRQEVCEAFDWFRSYQGGVYFTHNVTKGYLLSGFPSKRDGFFHNGKLIISHGGGKAESLHHFKGQAEMKAAEDQTAEDKSVRSLLTNYRQQQPLALLIDDKYAGFPFDLAERGVSYAVLGLYCITHAWAEYEPMSKDEKCKRIIRYKFAFQWCEEQGQPWWHFSEELISSEVASSFVNLNVVCPPERQPGEEISTKCIRRIPVKKKEGFLSERTPRTSIDIVCTHCGKSSPRVYTQGWACLNSSCSRFWTLPESSGISGGVLTDPLEYEESFLVLIPLLPIDPRILDLRPLPPTTIPSDGITTGYLFTRGIHCRRCGRLSCRFKWQHWECSHCQSLLCISGKIRKAKELKSIKVNLGFYDNRVAPASGIKKQRSISYTLESGGGGHCQTFDLPHGRGRIHHIRSNALGQRQADRIFEEYQEQAADGRLPFKRWPLRAHKLRGALLTNYFSQNCGEPYHYVGGTSNTLPWDRAPEAVKQARDLIESRMHQVLGMDQKFNEVLSAAYMEKQSMAFHSDDERGLGGVVAGLSLGSPALMHFRLHGKYVESPDQKGNLLSIILRHGDILVMDGADVQKCYEHTVVPSNFRIAATARWIQPQPV